MNKFSKRCLEQGEKGNEDNQEKELEAQDESRMMMREDDFDDEMVVTNKSKNSKKTPWNDYGKKE